MSVKKLLKQLKSQNITSDLIIVKNGFILAYQKIDYMLKVINSKTYKDLNVKEHYQRKDGYIIKIED